MKHTMEMFIADKKINDFMKMCDVRLDCKWFVHIEKVNFETTSIVDDKYFMNIIEKSKIAGDGFWVPAIKYMDNFFYDPEVKILSDGNTEMFIE